MISNSNKAKERFLCKAKSIKTGEWVQGFYVRLYNEKDMFVHRIYNGYAETDVDEWYEDYCDIDPNTVEPVAIKVDGYDPETLTGICPNCRTLVGKIAGPSYCKYCGQRLD